MKNSIIKTSGLIIAILLLINEQITAQVGIGTTTPDASSMLEIQSTAKGVLIPRMTTTQRTNIGTPATGLLVFDLTTSSFWFYSGAWVELDAYQDMIVDADGNTKIEVEQAANEDKIHFTTNGVEKMSIDATGNVRIGDGTNNTYIESDGSLRYEGTATRWDDLKVTVNSVKTKATTEPAWDELIDGFYTYLFDDGKLEEAFFMVQMPHAWNEGTNIMPHVHWMATSSSTEPVEWTLEYTWLNVNEVYDNSKFETITGSTPISSYAANKHMLTQLGPVGGMDGSGKTLSSMIICRLYRNGGQGNDNFTGDAGLLEIDFHFQLDSDGSRVEYTK